MAQPNFVACQSHTGAAREADLGDCLAGLSIGQEHAARRRAAGTAF